MTMPRYNLYDVNDTLKDTNRNQQLTHTERLDKLEKEVSSLRNDFDKIKYEQAIAEAAIGRAIIRGSASLGGCLVFPQTNSEKKNLMLENCPMNQLNTPKSLIESQYSPDNKVHSSNEMIEKLRKNENNDGGYFTLG